MLSLEERSLEISPLDGNLFGSKSKPRLGVLGVVAEVVGAADEDPYRDRFDIKGVVAGFGVVSGGNSLLMITLPGFGLALIESNPSSDGIASKLLSALVLLSSS